MSAALSATEQSETESAIQVPSVEGSETVQVATREGPREDGRRRHHECGGDGEEEGRVVTLPDLAQGRLAPLDSARDRRLRTALLPA